MVEEVKKEKIDLKESDMIAKLIVGTDNSATTDVGGYRFRFHYPSVLETLKIQTVAKNLRKDLEKDDDPDLRFQTIVLGTLEVVIDEILKLKEAPEAMTVKDNSNNLVRKMKFIEFMETLRNPMIWVETIFPLYESYLNFSNQIYIKDKDLKK
jgi:hypothetical protein